MSSSTPASDSHPPGFDDCDFNLGSLTPIEIPIGDQYVLREASEDVAKRFRNRTMAGAKVDSDGNITRSLDGMADLEPLLVAGCLFKKNPKQKDNGGPVFDVPVSDAEVGRMPARFVRKLFVRAKEISGIDERETVEGLREQIANLQVKLDKLLEDGSETQKNSSGATPGISG